MQLEALSGLTLSLTIQTSLLELLFGTIHYLSLKGDFPLAPFHVNLK